MLDKIWVFILLISVIFGFISGKAGELGSAAINGAGQAVTLVIGLTGALCFWQGMMAVMRECGAAAALARVLRRPVGLLMKKTRENARAMEAVCANISAPLWKGATIWFWSGFSSRTRRWMTASSRSCVRKSQNTPSLIR